MKLPFNLGRRRKSDAEDEEDPEFAGDPDDLYDPDDPDDPDRESSTAPPDDRPAAADGEDSEAEPVGGETDAGEDDLEDPADFDDDDDDGARDDKPSRRLWPPPRVAVFATIGMAGVLVVGGIVWWLMGTPDDGMAADHGAPKGPRVVVPLAPKSAAGSLNQLAESKPGNPATPPAGGLTPSPMGLTPSPAGLAPAPAGLAPPPTSPAMTEESAPRAVPGRPEHRHGRISHDLAGGGRGSPKGRRRHRKRCPRPPSRRRAPESSSHPSLPALSAVWRQTPTSYPSIRCRMRP